MKQFLRNITISGFTIILFFSCAEKNNQTTNDMKNKSQRGLADTIGFAISEAQVEAVVKMAEAKEAKSLQREKMEFSQPFIAGITPHDDYIYAGQVYVHIMNKIKAKRIILFGVAHKARKWQVKDKMIFDDFKIWKGPYGPVAVSGLRKDIIRQLPASSYLISNKYQAEEHSLEALIPLLQYYNRDVEIVPILIPYMNWEKMADLTLVLAKEVSAICKKNNWELGKDLGFLISNDCCHYGDQDWGGKNFASFGCEIGGYQQAMAREQQIIDRFLTGAIEPQRLKNMLYTLVEEKDVYQYKITWCGRFAVPFGLNFLYHLTSMLHTTHLQGELLKYGTSVGLGELPLKNTGLGLTAVSNLHHWVGYAAVGFR